MTLAPLGIHHFSLDNTMPICFNQCSGGLVTNFKRKGNDMDQDISKIIELIEKKIKALTVTRQTLIDEFGNGRTEPMPSLSGKVSMANLAQVKELTRKDAVEKLILEQGPMSRKDIVHKTGFPDGTVAFVLNDKKRFISKDGKWHIIGRGGE